MATWTQLGLQDVSSPFAQELLHFHDFLLVVLSTILVFVLYSLFLTVFSSFTNLFLLQGQMVETIWTVIPMFVLVMMGYPSMGVLYALEEFGDVDMTIKVMGHQWYWSYEYGDNFFSFDSFMVPTNDLEIGSPRLLEVDNRLILPFRVLVRVLVSSGDVIHSWAIPCLGVKMDAVPGRMNQLFTYIMRPGVYYGQCSEICGANHSFMPIVLEVLNYSDYYEWCSACESSLVE